MDGRTPSQYFAKLKQSYGDISLDDIVKEICVRQLPVDLQQTMCKDTEGLTASEMMKFADKFYNPDGSRIHKKPPSINAVSATKTNPNPTTAAFTSPFNNNDEQDDENNDVNAVRGRSGFQQQRQNGFNNGRSKSRGRFGNNNNNGGGGFQNRNGGGYNNSNNNKQNNNRQHDPALCFYHNMYGEKARKCDFGCAKGKQGNGPSPRQ